MLETKPLLLPHTKVSSNSVIRAESAIAIENHDEWPRFTRLLALCDGHHTPQEIASALSMEHGAVTTVLDSLEEAGFLWRLNDYSLIPVEVFQKEFKRWLPIWVDQMYDQPHWQGFFEGTVPAAVLVGWALENVHYTHSVMSHMPIAVDHAGDPANQSMQFKHLSEEWDHFHMFQDACRSVGYSDSAIATARPLVSTLSITNFMRSIARQGTLVYNACEALLEATTKNDPPVATFFEKVGEKLGLPHEFTRELVRHVSVDEDFEHIDIFDHLLARYPVLPRETVFNIFEACQRLADLSMLWQTEIYEFYRGANS